MSKESLPLRDDEDVIAYLNSIKADYLDLPTLKKVASSYRTLLNVAQLVEDTAGIERYETLLNNCLRIQEFLYSKTKIRKTSSPRGRNKVQSAY